MTEEELKLLSKEHDSIVDALIEKNGFKEMRARATMSINFLSNVVTETTIHPKRRIRSKIAEAGAAIVTLAKLYGEEEVSVEYNKLMDELREEVGIEKTGESNETKPLAYMASNCNADLANDSNTYSKTK